LNDPLQAAWINRGLDPATRATVLSLGSQSDALGQVAGGPVLGAVASGVSIRAALVAAGIVLSPVMLLYGRTLRRSADDPVLVVPEPAVE
jgi:DHA3 family tetracycline resistance protein-like MFS transporter